MNALRRMVNTVKNDDPPQAVARRTGSADAAQGSVAVTGTVVGDINLYTGVPVRTRYRQQVLRIAPTELLGREAELAELAEFCTAEEPHPSYAWWRGDAWAGKSALMSWFALNPPPGVRVVSFFVTARFASQSDRDAYIDNVLEQLATLLDAPIPAYLTDSTKEAHLLGMLSDAAEACRDRGERLVLIVDGLDEDRGVTAAPASHSIAALLPDRVPGDMRILVSGRPNPPIPADVRETHPLRDPSIIRPLDDSPDAQVIRHAMEGELRQLLADESSTQHDLLGLLTAARGGLSIADLAELTGQSQWRVSDELQTASGRSFLLRASNLLPGELPDLYILGHEELQAAAWRYLGSKLDAFRQRLHEWAARYRERDWPEHTPEYLLRGYFPMLREHGDLGRMITLATDRNRHDRTWSLSGGDNAALDEIRGTLDAVARADGPDLATMARLAVVRDYLIDRNDSVPVELPATWALLRQYNRAEALALSIGDQARCDAALVELVRALTARDERHRAEETAELISGVGRRGEAKMALLRAAAADGDLDSASRHLRSIPYKGEQAIGWIALALAAAEQGRTSEAREFAAKAEPSMRAASNLRRAGEALATMAAVKATLGERTSARELIAETEALVPSIESPSWQAAVWAALIRATAAVENGTARAEVDKARASVSQITDHASRTAAQASLARAVGTIGDIESARMLTLEAETLARTVSDPWRRSEIWAGLLRAAFLVDPEYMRQLAPEAESAVQAITGRGPRATAMSVLAAALAAIGEADQALRLANEAGELIHFVIDPEHRARDLATLATVTANARDFGQAEKIALSIPVAQSRQRDNALVGIVRAAAADGDLPYATTLTRSLSTASRRMGALVVVVQSAAESGHLSRAEEVAWSIGPEIVQAEALVGLVRAMAADNPSEAGKIALSIRSPGHRSLAQSALAESAAAASHSRLARDLAKRAEAAAMAARGKSRTIALIAAVGAAAVARGTFVALRIAQSIDKPGPRGTAVAELARVLVLAGKAEKAEETARTIEDSYWRATAYAGMIEAHASLGNPDDALDLIRQVQAQIDCIINTGKRGTALVNFARVLAIAGRFDEAERIIPTIPMPAQQGAALVAMSYAAEPGRAPEFIARAIQLSHWTHSLAAVVNRQPAALAVITQEVMQFDSGR
jgi:tetratricopeptide (TPR) repeat protein